MKTTLYTAAFLLMLGGNAFAKSIDGKKLSEVKEWVTVNGKKTLDQVSKYDDNGNKIEEIDYDKTGDQKCRITYQYNEKGKCIEQKHYDAYNKLEKTEKIEYNEFGKKSSVKVYHSNGKLKNEHTFEYITK